MTRTPIFTKNAQNHHSSDENFGGARGADRDSCAVECSRALRSRTAAKPHVSLKLFQVTVTEEQEMWV
jgi:hypothetical protein